MKYFLTILFILSAGMIFSQSDSIAERPDKDSIYVIVDKMPAFPGGEEKMYSYLIEKFIYPTATDSTCLPAKVFMSFTVDTAGNVVDPKVDYKNFLIPGCVADESSDKLYLKLITDMPKWEPGMKDGKKVRVRVSIPLHIDWEK